jgi:cytochrome c oxidase subunit 1
LPEESFRIFNVLLGDGCKGVMTNDIYLSRYTVIMVFCINVKCDGTFSNLLIPLQIGARDMASGFMNMLSYWLFFYPV